MKKSQNLFLMSKENIHKFYNEAAKNSPRLSKSIIKLQQEYIDAWKNVINYAMSLEHEYVTKLGCKINAINIIEEHVKEMIDISAQAYLNQNKITKCTEIATKNAFEAFNENTKSFVTLNEEILEYMITLFKLKAIHD